MAEKSMFHWIQWPQLCYPVEEGGTGFRRLRDIYKAFSCKLWWRFRTRSSLWATYLQANYCQVTLSLSATDIWRRMLNVSRQVELSMLGQVNEGSCHFWYDNWFSSSALFLRLIVIPDLTFKDFITNGEWDVQLLSRALPKGIIPSILQQSIPEDGRADKVGWMPMTSGKFTLALAFCEVHQASNTSGILSHVWHPRIPLKVSFFMLDY
ncbi:uncharacterized protein [Coffea arabica]|uniref:Uncharacterized protein n=1 Tax=Coffea arabica TaxID=13443 RepID=A0ABM4VZA5_COFAR